MGAPGSGCADERRRLAGLGEVPVIAVPGRVVRDEPLGVFGPMGLRPVVQHRPDRLRVGCGSGFDGHGRGSFLAVRFMFVCAADGWDTEDSSPRWKPCSQRQGSRPPARLTFISIESNP